MDPPTHSGDRTTTTEGALRTNRSTVWRRKQQGNRRHLADYVDKFPREKDSVDNVAKWLAGVEDLGHDHEARDVGSDAPQKT